MQKNKQKQHKMFFIYTKDFFNFLRAELHSERTIETYCQSLNAFRIYLYETYSKTVDRIDVTFVTEQLIRDFLSSVADNNSVGTRNVRLSGIKAYLKYAATRDMELVPLQINVSAMKHKKTYPKRHNWLDKTDVELILKQPLKTKIGIRDRFIILFLFSTGVRLAEMQSVQLKDVIITCVPEIYNDKIQNPLTNPLFNAFFSCIPPRYMVQCITRMVIAVWGLYIKQTRKQG